MTKTQLKLVCTKQSSVLNWKVKSMFLKVQVWLNPEHQTMSLRCNFPYSDSVSLWLNQVPPLGTRNYFCHCRFQWLLFLQSSEGGGPLSDSQINALKMDLNGWLEWHAQHRIHHCRRKEEYDYPVWEKIMHMAAPPN
jgi:hypothetical protein